MATTRAVVDGLTQAVLVAAAVTAVAALLRVTGPSACLAWLVVLAGVGSTGAALWLARSGDRVPGSLRSAGWWATTFLVANTLAVTSWDVYIRLLAVLLTLALMGLRLTALTDQLTGQLMDQLTDPVRPDQDHRAVGPGPAGARRPDAA